MREKLDAILKEAAIHIAHARDEKELFDVEVKYLGRKGEITLLFKELGALPAEEKREMGVRLNAAKKELESAFSQKRSELESGAMRKKLEDEWVDVTAPGISFKSGHIHPLAQVQYDVERIFSEMGFSIMDGPEVESEYYNFEGLNIPSWHPARDMQDTFFVKNEGEGTARARRLNEGVSKSETTEVKDELYKKDKKHGRLVLRTHTSPVQMRTMEKFGAPLRIIVPGRVFRNEATDARHEHTFDQVEGLLIDKNISLAHLKGVMQEFLTRLFGRPTKARFRPGYFPFVEPGLELDMSCLLCGEDGCRVCKHTGWLEFMGCGMTHPNVLRAGGIDTKKYQGWAFGFGLTRLTMMKYGIDDIRLLNSGDLRFLQQF